VPSQHVGQPPSLNRNGIMPATPQLVFDLCQCRPPAFLDRHAPDPNRPAGILAQTCVKPRKSNVSRQEGHLQSAGCANT
jgi:hypothetical protein